MQGRPLLNLSLAVNYALSGTSVWSYHAANVAIHILAGLTLYELTRRTFRLIGGELAAAADSLGLVIALLWIVHPLQTESVTYIVQRTESLMGFFYLFTLYAFVRSAELESIGWRAASVLCCAAGMATKEVMVSAPLMVLLYDRTFVAGTFGRAWRERKVYYMGLAATWLVLALLILGTGGNRGGSKGFDVGVSWWSWWATQFPAAFTYLRLALWPRPLVFEYGVEWNHPALVMIASVLVVSILLAATLCALVRRPAVGFLGACFFAILAPTSLTPGTSQMTAEHRMYLPLAVVITIVVAVAHRALRRSSRLVTASITGVIAAALIIATLQRNRDYRSEIAIWQDTVDKRPGNALAHEMLGMAQDRIGDSGDALEHFRDAIKYMPSFAIAHESLGELLFRLRQPAAALAEFQTALQLKPDFPDALDNLGGVLLAAGRGGEAIPFFQRALSLKPEYVEAHYNLATALAEVGRTDDAIGEFDAALGLRPEYIAAHYNLANTLATAGRQREAVLQYEAVLRLDPRHSRAEYNFANVLAIGGRAGDAIPHYKKAIALDPGYIEAHNNLGSALLEVGQPDAAAAEFAAALRLDPNFADARENLRRLEALRAQRP